MNHRVIEELESMVTQLQEEVDDYESRISTLETNIETLKKSSKNAKDLKASYITALQILKDNHMF